jgi:YebC/PmpR family DNA-binding regulatory protein
MAGHSKWSNIKHKKAKADAARGKIFTRLTRAITMAARDGGGDPATNFRLRVAIDDAREMNMPNDNIERAIKRGTGQLTGVNYEEINYEGYGPGGVAIMLDIITDNRNRTAGDMRHIFSKYGGNLGENGCVAWLFEKKGLLIVNGEAVDEEELMILAIDGGAEDFKVEDDTYEIITEPRALEEVEKYLEAQEIPIESADITMLPSNSVMVDGEDAIRLMKLLDALEDNDDVQKVYANFEIPDELMEELSN